MPDYNPEDFQGTFWSILDGDYYVSTIGNDISGKGTPQLPFLTVDRAYEEAIAGDKIVIGPDEYISYRDSPSSSIGTHPPCRVASISTFAFGAGGGGLATIDGVDLAIDDRVLLWKQTNPEENGIYIAAVGVWTRAEDFADADLLSGQIISVLEGDTFGETLFQHVTTGEITFETTPILIKKAAVTDWGEIQGTLDDQLDLKAALGAKAKQTDLTDHIADVDTELGSKSDKTNVLERDNVSPYIPSSDYHPTTVKFVEEKIAAIDKATPMGTLDCSSNPNYPSGEIGDYYYVSLSGKIGGTSGNSVQIGDKIQCIQLSAGGTSAAAESNWTILQGKLNKATATDAQAGTEDDKYMTAAKSYEGWQSWMKNKTVSELETTSKLIIGAINELKMSSENVLTLDNSSSYTPSSNYHPATKKFVDDQIASLDKATPMGTLDCSSNPNYPTGEVGEYYYISVAGKIGGTSGKSVQIGDKIQCIQLSAGGNSATAGSNWTILQGKLNKATATDAQAGTEDDKYMTAAKSYEGWQSWMKNKTVSELETTSKLIIGAINELKMSSENVLTLDNSSSYTPSSNYHPATKKFVEDQIASLDKATPMGTLDCSPNPNYPTGEVGEYYYISVAGKIGGANGDPVQLGDKIQCIQESASGTAATVGSNWAIYQGNLDKATNTDAQVGTEDDKYMTAAKSYTGWQSWVKNKDVSGPNGLNTTSQRVIGAINEIQTYVVTSHAATASRWKDSRTLALGAQMSGSVEFNGSANFTLDAALTVGAISSQTALTSGLSSTDEILINDGGTLKRMDVSVLQSYMQGNLPFAAISGANFTGPVNVDNTLKVTAPVDKNGIRILRHFDSIDQPASLLIATDADGTDDMAIEIRGNSSGSSVDISNTLSSPDTKFAIYGNGHTVIGRAGLGESYTALNGSLLDVNGILNVAGNIHLGGDLIGGNVDNWNVAHGWGDHADGGYLSAAGGTISGALTINGQLRLNGNGLSFGFTNDSYEMTFSDANPTHNGTSAGAFVNWKGDNTDYNLGHYADFFHAAHHVQAVNGFYIGAVATDGIKVIDAAGNFLKNAASATKWATARTITLEGDLTGSVSINGSEDAILLASYVDDGTFLRANANDIKTAGYLRMNDNLSIQMGNGGDFSIYFNGTDTYFKNNAHAGGDIIFQGEDSGGSNENLMILDTSGTAGFVRLFQGSNEKMRTLSGGIQVYGSIYAPDKIIHTGDTDTYTQFNAANSWRVVTGNGQRLLVNSAGITVTGNINLGSQTITDAKIANWDIAHGWGNHASAGYYKSGNTPTFGSLYIADKIMHTGDTDTYTQFNAANSWRVVTGNSQRLLVNSTGLTVTGNINLGSETINDAKIANWDIAHGWGDHASAGYYKSGNTPTFGSLYIADKIMHTGDTNNYMQFHSNDQWRVVCAGVEQLEIGNSYLQIPNSIRHTGDTDTYMQFNAADSWRVVTGDIERILVNNSGLTVANNIGIQSNSGNFLPWSNNNRQKQYYVNTSMGTADIPSRWVRLGTVKMANATYDLVDVVLRVDSFSDDNPYGREIIHFQAQTNSAKVEESTGGRWYSEDSMVYMFTEVKVVRTVDTSGAQEYEIWGHVASRWISNLSVEVEIQKRHGAFTPETSFAKTTTDPSTLGTDKFSSTTRELTTQSLNFGTARISDGANRPGLLKVGQTGTEAWSGISIEHSSSSAWSLIGDQDDFGIFDDYNDKWVLKHNENSSIDLYHDGTIKFQTNTDGIKVTGNVYLGASSITEAKIANWDTAHGWGNHASAGYLPTSGGTISGVININNTLTVSAPADEFGIKILRNLDSPDEPASLLIATDADSYDDMAIEIRGNSSGTSVDTSNTLSSTDTKFVVYGNGHTVIGRSSLGSSYTPINGSLLDINGILNVSSSINIGGDLIAQDFGIYFNGTNTYFQNSFDAGGKMIFRGKDSGGSLEDLMILDTTGPSGYVRLFHGNSERMRTGSTGIEVFGNIFAPDKIVHTGDFDTYIQFNAAKSWRVVTDNAQRLLVNNAGIVVTGTGTATDWVATSDEKLKTNIKPFGSVLDKIAKLKGSLSSYNWLNNGNHDVGYTAQKVKAQFPDFVQGQETLGVSYGKLSAVALEGVAEVHDELSSLKSEVKELKLQLKSLLN